MKLLFDCDGTILDSMHIWSQPIKKILQKYDYTLTKEEKGAIEALDYDSMCHWLAENVALDMSYEDSKEYFDKTINGAYENTLMPKDGAVEILKELKDQGFEMAIASSTDIKLLEKAFRRLEMTDYFEFIITPDSSPYNKGEKEFWELACYKINEDPENVLIYDDALYAVKAAKSAGLVTCGIKDFPYNENEWEYIIKEADMVLDSIEDIDIDKLK